MAMRPTGRTAEGKAPRLPGFKVRATQVGYFDDERKRPGDVFTLKYAHQFSKNWMERVDARTPHKTTTGAEVLRKEHEDILRMKSSGIPTSPDDTIPGAEEDFGADPLGANQK